MARIPPKQANPTSSPRTAPSRRPARAGSRKIIMPKNAPNPTVPLSHAVAAGGLVFVSGSTPFDKEGRLARGDFAAQMHQVMANLKVILADAGSSLERAVKVVVILTRIGDFAQMNEIYRTYFRAGNYPARTTIGGQLAHPDFLLEIECVAAV
jgi:2-iminobutanoate/2-iminopropanoate deaminase